MHVSSDYSVVEIVDDRGHPTLPGRIGHLVCTSLLNDAQIFLRYGEEEGRRWLLLNLQSHPNHRPSHRALADYYDRAGKPDLAAEHRRQAGAGEQATGLQDSIPPSGPKK